jgi:hypothetical protein
VAQLNPVPTADVDEGAQFFLENRVVAAGGTDDEDTHGAVTTDDEGGIGVSATLRGTASVKQAVSDSGMRRNASASFPYLRDSGGDLKIRSRPGGSKRTHIHTVEPRG